MQTKPPPHPFGKGKLLPHRAFILALADEGAGVSEIRAALLNEKSVTVASNSLMSFIKKQVAKRANAHALVDLKAAKLIKEAVDLAADLSHFTQSRAGVPAPTPTPTPLPLPAKPAPRAAPATAPAVARAVDVPPAAAGASDAESAAWNPHLNQQEKISIDALIKDAEKPKSFFKK